jgi:hypothetical protein
MDLQPLVHMYEMEHVLVPRVHLQLMEGGLIVLLLKTEERRLVRVGDRMSTSVVEAYLFD